MRYGSLGPAHILAGFIHKLLTPNKEKNRCSIQALECHSEKLKFSNPWGNEPIYAILINHVSFDRKTSSIIVT